jgi:hypothetical protein
LSISVRAMTPLPSTAIVPSPYAVSSRTASTRSPWTIVAPGQSTLVSVLVATYFGVALRWAAIGLSSGRRGQKAASRS